MVRCQTRVSVIAIGTGDCTIFLLQNIVVWFVLFFFGFWSSCLIIYIHLRCINTQIWTTTPFSLWLPLSPVSLLWWYHNNRGLRFVWFCLISIQLIIKFIPIYPAYSHSDEQQHHSTLLTSYHLATNRHQYFIRGPLIVVREILTWI